MKWKDEMQSSSTKKTAAETARRLFGLFAGLAAAAFSAEAEAGESGGDYLSRPPQDEIIYLVFPDRFENADATNDTGGLEGDRLVTGFDPAHKGFFHGGDLKGLTSRLDYIEKLGATAVWLGPIYKNKPVQGPPGDESAGYHGYWITDFTTVDPHFGSEDDLREFVEAAHARGLKVYLDIIVNHTADVIRLRECHDPDYSGDDKETGGCPYRSKAAYPFATRGGVGGAPINDGFIGDQPPFQTADNFAGLTRPDFAYTPYVPAGEENVKVPAWLNDVRYYHNRGDSTFEGESSLYGDFSGLDDLQTEDPRVVQGFVDIFSEWISKYRIDGFRVDTAKHVNPEFWQAFIPAILDHAASLGIPNFYIFAEAYEPNPAGLARHTRVDGFPATLDFAFQSVVADVVARGAPTSRFEELFAVDVLYAGGEATALGLPVFISNHDMGRFARMLREALPGASDEELLKRLTLAHAMMFFMRGAPIIYSGDEQGFVGDGGDQAAREDMFPSKVASYNDNDLVGTDKTTAVSNFDRGHPLFRALAGMAKIYNRHEALRRGVQRLRFAEPQGGLIALSRLGAGGGEYLVVFNTRNQPRTVDLTVDPRSTSWKSLHGECGRASSVRGSYRVALKSLDFLICRSNDWSAPE
jgi:glycosidase